MQVLGFTSRQKDRKVENGHWTKTSAYNEKEEQKLRKEEEYIARSQHDYDKLSLLWVI